MAEMTLTMHRCYVKVAILTQAPMEHPEEVRLILAKPLNRKRYGMLATGANA
jgi:hypothetical protein